MAADPPVGAPEPSRTNHHGKAGLFSLETFEQSIVPRKRSPRQGNDLTTTARSNPEFANTEDNHGRVTTKEVRRLIESLKEIIAHQTALIESIESTKTEIQEVKHDQNFLQERNAKLHGVVRALRAQLDAAPLAAVPTRTWAAVAAAGSNPVSQLDHRRPDKDQNCLRISTQRSFVDPSDNNDGEGDTFGRYLSTESANSHIRTALLNAPPTQDAEVAGIGTTKTGYVIRFKNQASADAARSNTEWLNELGNNTKLVKPRFGVVVHRTPTEDLDLENANTQAIEKIMEENDLVTQGFRVEEVAWLKTKDKVLGKFASLGIWFDSAKAPNTS